MKQLEEAHVKKISYKMTVELRNIGIIAHVDHWKTTLIDSIMKQTGMFRDNQQVDERLMDSGDLEKERGLSLIHI